MISDFGTRGGYVYFFASKKQKTLFDFKKHTPGEPRTPEIQARRSGNHILEDVRRRCSGSLGVRLPSSETSCVKHYVDKSQANTQTNPHPTTETQIGIHVIRNPCSNCLGLVDALSRLRRQHKPRKARAVARSPSPPPTAISLIEFQDTARM